MGRRPESISKSRSVLEAKVLGETKGKKKTLEKKKKTTRKKLKKKLRESGPGKVHCCFLEENISSHEGA